MSVDSGKKKYLLTLKMDLNNSIQKKPSIETPTIQQQINIFKKVIANDNKQYKEYGAGPQFDQNGVIQRSIVGKAEEFNRLKSLSLASIKFMQGGQSAAQKFAHRLSQKRISMIVKKNPTNDMQESKSTKRPKDYEIITKYDIIAKSKQAAQRILENERNYKKQLEQMPLAERLLKTKEERILQKFQEQQKIWQDEVAKVSLLSNRQMNDTVISHSNQYRKKVEQNEMNEALKQFEGEATTNMWYMSLRRNTSKEQQDKSKLLQDVKSNTILVDYTNKPIEVIRQQSFYSSNHSRLNSTGTFYSMNQTQNKLPFFKYTNLQDDNLEGFIVEGQNVLKQETDQLLLDTSDQQQFKLYKQQDV
ncbi:hypothetical protein pb186bvf_018459 [Paramecium bursaria]